jgi:hypothetical protein
MKHCKKFETTEKANNYMNSANNDSLPCVALSMEDKTCYFRGKTYTVTCIGRTGTAYDNCTVTADKNSVYMYDEDKTVSFNVYAYWGVGGFNVMMGNKDVTEEANITEQSSTTIKFTVEVCDDIVVNGWAV